LTERSALASQFFANFSGHTIRIKLDVQLVDFKLCRLNAAIKVVDFPT
jgi:hypothetical protein